MLLRYRLALHCNSTMTKPIQVRISRAGNEIGSYPSDEVVRLSSNGTLKETDFYWHEGMIDWAPLSRFLASETRRKLAEEALRLKQEEVKKAERLALERAKAKEDEERAAFEARMDRLEKEEKANQFRCNCCRERFPTPKDAGGVCVGGIALVVLSPLITWINLRDRGQILEFRALSRRYRLRPLACGCFILPWSRLVCRWNVEVPLLSDLRVHQLFQARKEGVISRMG